MLLYSQYIYICNLQLYFFKNVEKYSMTKYQLARTFFKNVKSVLTYNFSFHVKNLKFKSDKITLATRMLVYLWGFFISSSIFNKLLLLFFNFLCLEFFLNQAV